MHEQEIELLFNTNYAHAYHSQMRRTEVTVHARAPSNSVLPQLPQEKVQSR
jgi:hypothetical protein